MRKTNKKIIGELFPTLRWALVQNVEFEKQDYYGKLYKEVQKDGFPVRWTRIGDGATLVKVTMPLRGKYDHATVAATVYSDGKTEFSYSKEFTGKGNGYYALLNENEKIIKGEWD